jgi:hypothetical protein
MQGGYYPYSPIGWSRSITRKYSSLVITRFATSPRSDNRLHFVKAIDALLKNCYPLHSSILPARLAKSILPSISKILTTSSGTPTDNEPSSSKSKSGKKRARNYEGDEVFKTQYQTACPTAKEEQILLTSIDGMNNSDCMKSF